MKTIQIALITLLLLIFTQCDDSVSSIDTGEVTNPPTDPVAAQSDIVQLADSINGEQAKSTKFKLSDYFQSNVDIIMAEFTSPSINIIDLGDDMYQLSQPDSIVGQQVISSLIVNKNSDTLKTELNYIITPVEDADADTSGSTEDSTDSEGADQGQDDSNDSGSGDSNSDEPVTNDPDSTDTNQDDVDTGDSGDTDDSGTGNSDDTEEPAPDDSGDPDNSGTDPEPTELVIMPLGDSMTNDSRSRVKLWNLLVADDHEVDFVGDQKQNSSIPDADHEGVGGIKIQGIADKIESLMQKYDPQYVNLMVGTNDIAWYFDETGEEIANRWNDLVQKIYDNSSSGTYIIAATIPPVTSKNVGSSSMTTKDRVDLIAEYNEAIREIVKNRRAAGDLIVLADMAKNLNVNDHVSGDGVHLNDTGYALMGTVYYEAINSILD